MMKTIRLGSRSTPMALAQSQMAKEAIERTFPEINVEVDTVSVVGDRDHVSKLGEKGGKSGAFVEEIREKILSYELDVAMHSLKDMPGNEDRAELTIGAVLRRDDPRDVLVSRLGSQSPDKHAAIKLGTQSVRRAAICAGLYPNAEIIHYRGGAVTRVRKLDDNAVQDTPDGTPVGPADGLIMGKAGLERVGLRDRITRVFSLDEMMPPPGQGTIALECLTANYDLLKILNEVNHKETMCVSLAERELLWVLNGHCNSPIAAICERISATELRLRAQVFSLDGQEVIAADLNGRSSAPRELGRAVARELLRKGAEALIENPRKD